MFKMYKDKNECESCNLGYSLINGKCKVDYLFEAVYQTKADGDTINLVYSSTAVIYMIIDEIKITKPGESYQFLEKGNPEFLWFSEFSDFTADKKNYKEFLEDMLECLEIKNKSSIRFSS